MDAQQENHRGHREWSCPQWTHSTVLGVESDGGSIESLVGCCIRRGAITGLFVDRGHFSFFHRDLVGVTSNATRQAMDEGGFTTARLREDSKSVALMRHVGASGCRQWDSFVVSRTLVHGNLGPQRKFLWGFFRAFNPRCAKLTEADQCPDQ